jgi:chorismate lyase/3-hydroxybenzoate synthase
MHRSLSSAPTSRLGETEWYSALLDRLPTWPLRLVPGLPARGLRGPDESAVVDVSETYVLASYCIAGATGLSNEALEREVAAAYRTLFAEVALHGRHVVRCWNFIPGIQDATDDGMNRYMVFNAGRHRGYRDACQTSDLPPSAIATASGVGTDGDDLFIAALGALRAGVPIENPRQIPAYRYSARYGPIPPCFSRATLELEPKRLFVGGTSSVCGEDSVHPESFDAQLDETLVNLDALIAEAARCAAVPLSPIGIAGFSHARVYVVHEADGAVVRNRLMEAGVACPIETVVARLCRAELLVEIEGVVTF